MLTISTGAQYSIGTCATSRKRQIDTHASAKLQWPSNSTSIIKHRLGLQGDLHEQPAFILGGAGWLGIDRHPRYCPHTLWRKSPAPACQRNGREHPQFQTGNVRNRSRG